ncbi:MAG: hypothetical protein JXR59_10965 [Desulfuromonadaceae bacterium]|nr:hypothetical protein [Desulfuromonadaceae bacterium]
MVNRLYQWIPLFYIFLCVLLGLSLAWFVSAFSSSQLQRPLHNTQNPGRLFQPTPASTAELSTAVILQRNLFNARSKPLTPATDERPLGPTRQAPADLVLVGTIAGHTKENLAVIQSGKEIKTYHAGDEIRSVGRIVSIQRNEVQFRSADNSLITLVFDASATSSEPPATPGFAPRNTSGVRSPYKIQQLTETQWKIEGDSAEAIRENIADIIRQVRLEPVVNHDKTEGFIIRHVRRDALLSQMGLKRGDILRQVNGLDLDSPEKGLQVFQQLREAKSLNLALERNGEPLIFQYEVQ